MSSRASARPAGFGSGSCSYEGTRAVETTIPQARRGPPEQALLLQALLLAVEEVSAARLRRLRTLRLAPGNIGLPNVVTAIRKEITGEEQPVVPPRPGTGAHLNGNGVAKTAQTSGVEA